METLFSGVILIVFGLATIVFARVALYIIIGILKLPFDKRFWQ